MAKVKKVTKLRWQSTRQAVLWQMEPSQVGEVAEFRCDDAKKILSPGRSSAVTRPWRRLLRPHVTPRHWHASTDLLPQDARALDGSLLMCDLKDKSAALSVALLVEALWLSGRDGSTDMARTGQHAMRRKVTGSNGDFVVLIVASM